MKLILFLALSLVVVTSLIPASSSAFIKLNLNYPEFGNITLDKAKCEALPPGKICGQNPNALIAWIYYFIVGIAGLAAFVMLVWGGVQWLTSGAIPSQAGEARDKIRNAILGLLLVLASFLIIQILNPELTILKLPGFSCPAGVICAGEIPALPEFTTGGCPEPASILPDLVIYEDEDFVGPCLQITSNETILSGLWHDATDSIRYSPDCQVDLFEDADFEASSQWIEIRGTTVSSYSTSRGHVYGLPNVSPVGQLIGSPISGDGFVELAALRGLPKDGGDPDWGDDIDSLRVLNPADCL